MKTDQLSVFFPAYNEEDNIAGTVEHTLDVLRNVAREYEVIVVNDGSQDGTAEVVEALAKEHLHLRLINHEQNRGYGAALRTGFEAAKYPWVAFTDSDGQFDFREIERFLPLTDQADLILGYRTERADSILRRLYTWGWALIPRILLGLNVRDYSCGFKLIRKEVIKAIKPITAEEKVYQIEMLAKAKRKGYRFAEVGVHHYPREHGTQTGASPMVVLRSIKDMAELSWRWRSDSEV